MAKGGAPRRRVELLETVDELLDDRVKALAPRSSDAALRWAPRFAEVASDLARCRIEGIAWPKEEPERPHSEPVPVLREKGEPGPADRGALSEK